MLFIVGGGEILYSEGTTQDDPTAVVSHALGNLPLIKFLLEFINLNKMNANEVVFEQDFSVTGNLNSLKVYWDKLTAIGPKYGYFPKPTKSYLIAKKKQIDGSIKLICQFKNEYYSCRKKTPRCSCREYRIS